jgi:hypothetical protein
MPPLVISIDQLKTALTALKEAVQLVVTDN